MTVTMFKDAFIGLYHFTLGHAVFVAPRRRVPMRETIDGPLDLDLEATTVEGTMRGSRLSVPVLLLILPICAACIEADRVPHSVDPPVGSGTRTMYDPATFRNDISRFIQSGHFRDAALLVQAADVDRQLKHDSSGYLAVGEDLIVLPGVDPDIQYDAERDWCFPGTQDAIQDAEWQAVATNFAKHYNRRRATLLE